MVLSGSANKLAGDERKHGEDARVEDKLEGENYDRNCNRKLLREREGLDCVHGGVKNAAIIEEDVSVDLRVVLAPSLAAILVPKSSWLSI